MNSQSASEKHIFLNFTSAATLRGRQSVRATFRLSAATIDAVSALAAHLGIKQKSLFDHLLDDSQALETIASRAQQGHPLPQQRVQKTFVMSRRALHALEGVAKEFQTSRDVLIEHSVQKLLPLIQLEGKKHVVRKTIAQELHAHLATDKELLVKTKKLLGEDDIVYQELAAAFALKLQATKKIDEFIQRGKIIERFHLD